MFGTGGAGGNAVNNMITAGLQGVDFVVANTDAQALTCRRPSASFRWAWRPLKASARARSPDVGRAAAEEVIDEIRDHLSGAHMCFVTAGMGGGTGTGAAPVVARAAREGRHSDGRRRHQAIPFRGRAAHAGCRSASRSCTKVVDTLLIIPNQNLFRVANEKTTFADAFAMADRGALFGRACITDLMVKEGLINLDFADVRAVMREMGKAMMGTGEASGEKRALDGCGSRHLQSADRRRFDEGRAEGCSSRSPAARTSRCMRSTRPRPAFARRSTRTPTSSWARPSTNGSRASSGCRSWPPASIRPRWPPPRNGRWWRRRRVLPK